MSEIQHCLVREKEGSINVWIQMLKWQCLLK